MTEAGKRVDQDAVKALLAELTKLLDLLQKYGESLLTRM
jgi:hypothetical protein